MITWLSRGKHLQRCLVLGPAKPHGGIGHRKPLGGLPLMSIRIQGWAKEADRCEVIYQRTIDTVGVGLRSTIGYSRKNLFGLGT
jgi:hypothetical protein